MQPAGPSGRRLRVEDVDWTSTTAALTMGMFDWYLPDPPLPCRWCGAQLAEFQGEQGPCELLVWQERRPEPVDQRCDDQWRLPDTVRQGLRLPSPFAIRGVCESCTNHSDFTCYTVSGTWIDSVLGRFDLLDHPIDARDLGAGWRQCTRCASHWAWPVERRLSECPECHALTTLVNA